jgi:glycogen debranching enzyme
VTDLGPLSEVICVRGESFVISAPNGDITPGGDHGVYVRDTRFVSRLELRVDDRTPTHLSGASVGGSRAIFHSYLVPSRDTVIDPTVSITRRRSVDGGLREEIVLSNAGADAVRLGVTLLAASDFAYIFDVKHGRVLDTSVPHHDGDALAFHRSGGQERTTIRLAGAAAQDGGLATDVLVPAGGSRTLVVEVHAADLHGEVAAPTAALREPLRPHLAATGPIATTGPTIHCSDPRFSRLVRRSFADLTSLTLEDDEVPDDRYAAAGSPWFLTLFGRDSIWAARMALSHDLDLARGTLRVLARRQGTQVDPVTEEEPGKILHEVRRGALVDRGDLPPVYYGTVDATPLFVTLVHEAWCWGLPDAEVQALLPNVEAALTWLRDHGDPDGDGFVEYVQHGARSLANQGWKDSHDGIRFADGSIARAPLALSEVQGYAYDAAVRGAALLDHFGRPGGDAWRAWAADLRERFRAAFWVDHPEGAYPAVALDERKRPVDAIASNMGHLLTTDLLDPDETALVAARLAHPGMSSGWGLRTLSSRSGGFNPLSYHCGAVWPHDTAIAVWGLARNGHAEAATSLLRGLLRAAPTFNYRLPELFSGVSAEDAPLPVPYPSACRPQAWAAGGALLLVRALLGVDAHLPTGRLTLRPVSPAPFDRLELTGIPFAGGRIDISLRDEAVSVELHGTQVDVVIEHP